MMITFQSCVFAAWLLLIVVLVIRNVRRALKEDDESANLELEDRLSWRPTPVIPPGWPGYQGRVERHGGAR